MKYRQGAVEDIRDAHILDEPPKLSSQALNLLVGECLGQGAYRRVYALKHSPGLVLKLEYCPDFMNVREWHAWEYLRDTEWSRWLAPCVSIDEFSGALVQERADDLTDEQWEQLVEYPNFLGDVGRRNWGWLKDRPVMRDYAINHLMHRGLNRVRMLKRDK